MRIVQIIGQLSSGGAERFTVNLCNELNNLGHEVHLIIFKAETDSALFCQQFLHDKVFFHTFALKGAPFWKVSTKLCYAIKKIQPDIINCHLDSIKYLIPVYLLSRANVFHTLHNIASKASGDTKLHSILYKFLYKTGMVQPVTISDLCHDTYIEYYNLHNDITIPNGCPPALPTAHLTDVQLEIKSYKQTPKSKIFTHVARFSKQKNQKLLIEAFNRLYNENEDFVLLIIGRDFDSEEGKKLVNSACDRIHFIGEKSNVADYLSCSDAFCLTSVYEGLPISLLEAMSMGVVPVCTAVGGIPDVVTDGISGFLADVNIDSYVDALHRFISSPPQKQVVIKEYNEKFSMKKCALNYLRIYQQ